MLRTDNTSCLLSSATVEPLLTRDYVLVEATADPYVAREFRTYKRNVPAYRTGALSEPLTATALGVLLFREHLGAIAIAGILLIAGLARLTIARK